MVNNSDNEHTFPSGARTGKRSGFEPAEKGAKNNKMQPEIEADVDARISGTYNRRRDTQDTIAGEPSGAEHVNMTNAALVSGAVIIGAALITKALDQDSRPVVAQTIEVTAFALESLGSAGRDFVETVKEHLPEVALGVAAVGTAAALLWDKLKDWAKGHEQDNDQGRGR